MSGLPLSPHYPVPTSPSVLWVAEGIDSDRMDWKPHFEDYYSRMDYKAAKKLRALKQFGKPDSEPMSLTSKSENIYAHVSRSAATDTRIVANVPPSPKLTRSLPMTFRKLSPIWTQRVHKPTFVISIH